MDDRDRRDQWRRAADSLWLDTGARYIRLERVHRATMYGYSLDELELRRDLGSTHSLPGADVAGPAAGPGLPL
ncbi:hypothetical protein ACQHIV_03920 [Kribbella sp. GL6]|uniref:hypothetical protein n=1 Tax=Kribbella sp. GL6 TaxID=3419765 RepID=UPI003D063226